MTYCIPVYYGESGSNKTCTDNTAIPQIEQNGIPFPTNIKDTDIIRYRIGWNDADARNGKIWFVDSAQYTTNTGTRATRMGAGTGVKLSEEFTTTGTNNTRFPITEGSIAVGSTLGGHIRGNGGVDLYIGVGASGSGGGAYAGLSIWIEGTERL